MDVTARKENVEQDLHASECNIAKISDVKDILSRLATGRASVYLVHSSAHST